MAALRTCEQPSSLSNVEISVNVTNNGEKNHTQAIDDRENEFDFSQKAQWLRAAVLGANDGLVSVSSLMMGIGAVKNDIQAMLLAGFAGLIAGAFSMAVGEFVSVYTQKDIEVAEMKRVRESRGHEEGEENERPKNLPNPVHAAIASGLAFSFGAVVPLLAAVFIRQHKMRLVVVVVVASLTLAMFGIVGAVIGRTPMVRSSFRVVIGGWMAIAFTFGLTKLIGTINIGM